MRGMVKFFLRKPLLSPTSPKGVALGPKYPVPGNPKPSLHPHRTSTNPEPQNLKPFMHLRTAGGQHQHHISGSKLELLRPAGSVGLGCRSLFKAGSRVECLGLNLEPNQDYGQFSCDSIPVLRTRGRVTVGA